MRGRITGRLRIIVGGMVGLYPVGGVAWDYLQYVIGLAGLGHDVYYHEDTWSWPYHPVENTATADGEYSARFIGEFFEQYAPELRWRWHYLHLHERSYGMTRSAFDEVARTADLFLNVSGTCFIPESLSPTCIKSFLDTDPGYNQIVLSEGFAWSENVDRWRAAVAAHDRHFTYAENMHGPDCLVPKLGIAWRTTRMPVVTELWARLAANPAPPGSPWTTVMTWNAFKGKLVYQGIEYQSKGPEFEKLLDLPGMTALPLKIALGGKSAPLDRVQAHGWQVVDGPSATLTPERYQAFIGVSRGELSTAKHVYTALRTGWFSCRSACYLAAGRPVVVQDTGFPPGLPVGEGVLPFSTQQQAAEALREAEADYARHARAALEIAHEYFGSERVLTRLLEDTTHGCG
jgi:hypothetical protein